MSYSKKLKELYQTVSKKLKNADDKSNEKKRRIQALQKKVRKVGRN